MLKIAIFCLTCGILLFIFPYALPKQSYNPCLYVASEVLNIRESPNTTSKIQGKLHKNTAICQYSAVDNNFLRIGEGWVSMDYLSLNAPLKPSKGHSSKNNPPNQQDIFAEESVKNSKFSLTSVQKDSSQDTLTLARESLMREDYRLAKTLALQNNKENPSNIESWEIFIKSVYLEGNIEEAISILQQFLAKNYNEKLFSLLKKLQEGNVI